MLSFLGFLYDNVIKGHSKKSLLWTRPLREMRFFGVQHVAINTFEVFSDVANFGYFCCISWEFFEQKNFKLLKMDRNRIYLINWTSDISKITFPFIFYACCLNKTTKNTNKKTSEQFSWHFFLNNPLSSQFLLLFSLFEFCFFFFIFRCDKRSCPPIRVIF